MCVLFTYSTNASVVSCIVFVGLCSNLRKHDPQETISGAFLQSCRVTLICLVTCACVCVLVCMLVR